MLFTFFFSSFIGFFYVNFVFYITFIWFICSIYICVYYHFVVVIVINLKIFFGLICLKMKQILPKKKPYFFTFCYQSQGQMATVETHKIDLLINANISFYIELELLHKLSL